MFLLKFEFQEIHDSVLYKISSWWKVRRLYKKLSWFDWNLSLSKVRRCATTRCVYMTIPGSVWQTRKYRRNLLLASKGCQQIKATQIFSPTSFLLKSQKTSSDLEKVCWSWGLAGAPLEEIFLNSMLIYYQACFQNQRRHNFKRILRLKTRSSKDFFHFNHKTAEPSSKDGMAERVLHRKALCLPVLSAIGFKCRQLVNRCVWLSVKSGKDHLATVRHSWCDECL